MIGMCKWKYGNPMKLMTFTGCMMVLLCLFAVKPAVSEEVMYISGIMEVTLRTGPGIDHKILAMVRSGQKLVTMKQGNDWTQVSLPSGKVGWVLTRFLTKDRPRIVKLEWLEQKHQQLTEKYTTLKEESEKTQQEYDQLKKELTETQQKLENTTTQYEALKSKSNNFFQLEEKYKETTAQLDEKTQLVETLSDKLGNENWKFFLCGAGVLFGGFIIGFSTRPKRRRSSLL